jgi:iron complex transport system substrate-binding protein
MRRRALLAAALCAGLTVACSRSNGASARKAEAQRVVSLAPSTTEAMFAIGAGDRVVGRSRYCDWPPEVARLPSVGGLEPDLEAVLLLRPDLVVGPREAASSRLAEQLAARGIASWFPPTESLASIDELLAGLGDRTGHGSEARKVVADHTARELAIEHAVAGERRPTVLMVVDVAPIVVAGSSSYVGELIRRAGGTNAVDAAPPWPTLGLERVVELDPEVILDASGAAEDTTPITTRTPGWGVLRAVREGRVVPMHDSRVLRPGPRVVEGLAVLVRALHPHAAIP